MAFPVVSGKTTILAKIALKEIDKIVYERRNAYSHVYTNFFLKGAEKIDFKDLGKYNFENSLILLDEMTLDADNRDFKSFSKSALSFFTLHRHMHCDVIYCAQNYQNVDKKIRDLTEVLYYVKSISPAFEWLKKLLPISRATQVFRTIAVNEYTSELVTGYRMPSRWEKIFGRIGFWVWRPSYYKYFDSYENPFSCYKMYVSEYWGQSHSPPPIQK